MNDDVLNLISNKKKKCCHFGCIFFQQQKNQQPSLVYAVSTVQCSRWNAILNAKLQHKHLLNQDGKLCIIFNAVCILTWPLLVCAFAVWNCCAPFCRQMHLFYYVALFFNLCFGYSHVLRIDCLFLKPPSLSNEWISFTWSFIIMLRATMVNCYSNKTICSQYYLNLLSSWVRITFRH